MFSARALAFLCAVPLAIFAQTNSTPHTPFPSATGTPLATQITALIDDPRVARAHWGIAVTELDGTPIYGLDEGKLFRPASNAKLFTTAAAMALLGPDATVSTTVEGEMDSDGTVHGDLRLVGHGDATFGSEDLPYVSPKLRPKDDTLPTPLRDIDELVAKLKQAGLEKVQGGVIGDDAAFPYEPVIGSWDVGDLVWGYGAPVSALTIANNELKLTIAAAQATGGKTSAASSVASVTLDQFGVPFYNVTSQVYTTAAGSGTHIDVEGTGPHAIRVYGSIASDAKPDIEHISIDEPALFTAMALRRKLIAAGIAVNGQASAFHFAPIDVHETSQPLSACERQSLGLGGNCVASCYLRWQGKAIVSHTSAPLTQDITFTLKVSQNLHAELLAQRVRQHGTCLEGEAPRLVKGFLTQRASIDPDDLFLYDGSGLSGHDLITPRAAAQLLTWATKQPWFLQWKAALPVGGEDGSLASRFPDAPLKDHVFAKTGTLGESRALSGYLDCKSGKQVIFSVLVDDHAPSGSNDREVMDKIVAAIAANN